MIASRGRRGLLALCPHRYCRSGVTDVAIEELREAGIEAVLLDLDNTLVGWRSHEVPEPVLEWVTALKSAGFKLCLVSNTRYGRRLRALSEALGVPYVRRAWKPRRRGFQAALSELGVDPTRTAMIGDQMFTDVLGGNRVGLYTVMVRPLARREFVGTKVSRLFEGALLRWFLRTGRIGGEAARAQRNK